jgi:hypothetical protein
MRDETWDLLRYVRGPAQVLPVWRVCTQAGHDAAQHAAGAMPRRPPAALKHGSCDASAWPLIFVVCSIYMPGQL